MFLFTEVPTTIERFLVFINDLLSLFEITDLLTAEVLDDVSLLYPKNLFFGV